MDSSYNEISNALQDYFDGFYDSDVATLKRIFHPNAHLYSAADGPLVDDDMDAVYARVEARTAPSSMGQPRMDKILSIDRSGPESALAKVQLAIGDRFYTDYLTMLKVDGGWRIISKTWTYVPLSEAKAQAAE